MAPLTHLILVCASLLSLTLSCVGVESTRTDAGAGAPAAAATNSDFTSSEFFTVEPQNEEALLSARRMDREGRTPDGKLALLNADEHMRRAATYHAFRAFTEAREHWDALLARYPEDRNVPAAMFGIGRSLFQERRYADALPIFEKLGNLYQQTEAGRDGFYYVAATLLRMERAAEAAPRYVEYTERFPQGERIENAYLNVIDSYREAGRPEDALPWVARTRERFAGQPTATNALFARLRLDVSRGDWPSAISTSDELIRTPLGRGVGTNANEVSYLKAYSLERMGRKEEASRIYQTIPDGANSYYGGLATSRLVALGGASRTVAARRTERLRADITSLRNNYPTPYREIIVQAVKGKKVDGRLMLAIMRQESGFNPRAKSAAAARGLMQFTIDTASKYAERAGLKNLREDDLYRPEVSIRLASEYLDELATLFPNLPEASAASYNGGEDSVARWVKRAGHTDPGVFTSEVGFAESKDYVYKVMANYRAYQQLYTDDLRPRR